MNSQWWARYQEVGHLDCAGNLLKVVFYPWPVYSSSFFDSLSNSWFPMSLVALLQQTIALRHTASQCVGSRLAFWFSCGHKIFPHTAHSCLLFRWCSASVKRAPRQRTACLLILLPNWNSPPIQHSTDPCLPLPAAAIRKLEVVIAAKWVNWTTTSWLPWRLPRYITLHD